MFDPFCSRGPGSPCGSGCYWLIGGSSLLAYLGVSRAAGAGVTYAPVIIRFELL